MVFTRETRALVKIRCANWAVLPLYLRQERSTFLLFTMVMKKTNIIPLPKIPKTSLVDRFCCSQNFFYFIWIFFYDHSASLVCEKRDAAWFARFTLCPCQLCITEIYSFKNYSDLRFRSSPALFSCKTGWPLGPIYGSGTRRLYCGCLLVLWNVAPSFSKFITQVWSILEDTCDVSIYKFECEISEQSQNSATSKHSSARLSIPVERRRRWWSILLDKNSSMIYLFFISELYTTGQ